MLSAHWLCVSFVRPVVGASLCGQNACPCCVEGTCCETGPPGGIRSGWPGGTVGRCTTHDCVIEKTLTILVSNAYVCTLLVNFCCIIGPTGSII